MRHTTAATEHAWITFLMGVVLMAAAMLTLSARPQSDPLLDLTPDIPTSELGIQGIPGMTFRGGSSVVSVGPTRYQLPLTVQILRVIPNESGNFVIELFLRNVGITPFDLPVARNLSEIQRPGNQSQRMFFLSLRPAGSDGSIRDIAEGRATGGSTTIIGSYHRLDPGSAMRVLLPASATLLKRAFYNEMEVVTIRVVCKEWKLRDTEYFLDARSDEVFSTNQIEFTLRDSHLSFVQP